MKEERKGGVRNHGCGEKNKRTHHHLTPIQGDERQGSPAAAEQRSLGHSFNFDNLYHIILMIIPRRAGGGLLVVGVRDGTLVSKEPQSKTKERVSLKNAAEMFSCSKEQ